MSVYFIAQIRITDQAEYERYLEKCDLVFSRYRGRYLSVDPSPCLIEGSWDYSRTVLIEFPERKDFYEWYESKEYGEILRHRLSGALCDSILIQGK